MPAQEVEQLLDVPFDPTLERPARSRFRGGSENCGVEVFLDVDAEGVEYHDSVPWGSAVSADA